MWIDSIKINYANTPSKEYFFEKTNLLSSNGVNSKGKTSLIRFIIWGLGFNVALTNEFMSMYAETSLVLSSPSLILTRKGNHMNLSEKGVEQGFELPSQENTLMSYLFPDVPEKIVDQLLGFMYFDQDGGYRAWNRNYVTQRLKQERTYKISIEALLASLGNIDYEKYEEKGKRLKKVKEETSGFTELIAVVSDIKKRNNEEKNVDISEIQQLNDEISKKQLRLKQVAEKRKIYAINLKDQVQFKQLLKKLSLKVNIDGRIIDVTDSNIVQNKYLKVQLTEYEKHYKYLEKNLISEISSLKAQREVLLDTAPDPNSLFEVSNNFSHLQQLISVSGITIEDVQNATEDIINASKKVNEDYRYELKRTDAYNDIWNTIVSLAQKVDLTDAINYKRNGLLDQHISYSGAKRSLIVMTYRLGIMKYLYERFNIMPPIILDSPASQEMDEANLNKLLRMVINEFPGFQIIVATNQKNDIAFEQIHTLEKGVLGTKAE